MTESVNPLVADSFALWAKYKNYHWHLSGVHFRDLHLLFDEHAKQARKGIDPLAERVRKIGGTTLRGLAHMGQLAKVADDNRDFVDPEEMVRILIEDNRGVAKRMEDAIEVCEDNHDETTSDLIQSLLDETQERIWFLFEISRGHESSK